jgi:hypothetical protein
MSVEAGAGGLDAHVIVGAEQGGLGGARQVAAGVDPCPGPVVGVVEVQPDQDVVGVERRIDGFGRQGNQPPLAVDAIAADQALALHGAAPQANAPAVAVAGGGGSPQTNWRRMK